MRGVVPKRDLLLSINCVDVDCKDLEKCRCNSDGCGTPTAHFEIPQLLTEFDGGGIEYIGTTYKSTPFVYYMSPITMRYHKYRSRAKKKPYVYIDTTPNENNMYDCYIFNAPLIK